MDMNQPAPPNPLDANRHQLIGSAMDRVDGHAKVTGQAPYAFEVKSAAKPAYGWIVEATIAKGRIAAIDTGAAEKAPGVLHVMTHRNAPPQAAYTTEGEDRFACIVDDDPRYEPLYKAQEGILRYLLGDPFYDELDRRAKKHRAGKAAEKRS